MDELNKSEFTNEANEIVNKANDISSEVNEIADTAEYVGEAVSSDMDQSFSDQPISQPVQTPVYTAQYQPHEAEISYAPVKTKKTKKKKEARPAKLSSVIAICLAAILLCGCAGFGGSLLAHKLTSDKTTANRSLNDGAADDAPLVIYRDANGYSVPDDTENSDNKTYKQIAASVKDSVVEINTEFTSRSAWFQYLNGGAGSGVILTDDGYIVTNAHVVMNEDSSALADSVKVRLSNGDEYPAEVKGYDTEADIAVLKIEAEGLSPAVCGNSDSLAAAEEVLVIGNPLGELGGSVTKGIVSATEREIEVSGTKMTLIQTDAAVNPGNSGGGMFNMAGELVGIVNAKSSGTDIEGLGFAIPINNVLTVTEQLMEYGYVRGKITIGATFRTISNGSFSGYYNIRPGVYVDSLKKDMNDDVLKVGDRIIAVNGEEITSGDEIASKISGCSVGDKVKFQLYRDNKLTEVTVTCYEKLPTEQDEIEFDDNGKDEQKQDDYYDDYYDDFFSPFGGFEDFFGGFFGR